MKFYPKALLLLAPAFAWGASITPVQQVLTMLGEMKAKGQTNLAVEQKVYATYKEWVSDREKDLGFDIETAEGQVSKLTAFIDEATSKAAQLADAIAELDGTTAQLEGEQKDSTTIRDSEKAEYEKVSQDLSESVDALERAIQTMSSQDYDRPQAQLWLQQMAKKTPGMRRVLAALLQEKGRAHDDGAPEVAAYKFQSGEIVDTLEALLKKFKGELSDTQMEETNKAHYYSLEMIQLTDTIAKTKSDREEKATRKAEIEGEAAKAKGELADTKKGLASDQKFLAEMQAEFAVKTTTFNSNQKVREDEVAAIAKAIEVISDPNVAASYAKHINLVQVGSRQAANFLQMRSTKRRVSAKEHAREHAIKLLQKRAVALSSTVLSKLAAEAAANPFEKVIGMIRNLLETLKAEAAAEASHKAWCDEQLKANKLKREKKTSEADKLSAEIDELSGQIDTMASDIATLAQEQAELAKAMTDATAQRSSEKAVNVATIADAQAGSAAVKKAMVILEEFYAAQSSLLQKTGHKQVPAMEAYKGLQSEKGGVMGMLEVIETDFTRLEAETTSAERTAARTYDGFMSEAAASKKMKHKQEVKLRLDKDQAEFEKSEMKKDYMAVSDELDKANAYYADLKPICVQIHVSYEERVARRKQELAALNEAYAILDAKSK